MSGFARQRDEFLPEFAVYPYGMRYTYSAICPCGTSSGIHIISHVNEGKRISHLRNKYIAPQSGISPFSVESCKLQNKKFFLKKNFFRGIKKNETRFSGMKRVFFGMKRGFSAFSAQKNPPGNQIRAAVFMHITHNIKNCIKKTIYNSQKMCYDIYDTKTERRYEHA